MAEALRNYFNNTAAVGDVYVDVPSGLEALVEDLLEIIEEALKNGD
jgi:hypothetical protein